MSGAGDARLYVSSWGYFNASDDGDQWRQWSVRVNDVRVCFLALPPELGATDALILAYAMYPVTDAFDDD